MARLARIRAPSDVTMPALSWPRCWSAYNPRYVRLAASGLPKIPKTPHSSLNLSSMVQSGSELVSAVALSVSTRILRRSAPEVTRNRRRPQLFGFIDGDIQHRAVIHPNGDPPTAGASDEFGRHARVGRHSQKSARVTTMRRYHHTRRRLAEECRDVS